MHIVNRGDTPRLRWALDRDLTGTTSQTLLLRESGAAVIVALTGALVIDDPAAGIVAYKVQDADWGAGKLAAKKTYWVKVETVHPTLGRLTHPNTWTPQFEKIVVLDDLG